MGIINKEIERVVVAIGDPHATYSNVREIQELANKIVEVVGKVKNKYQEAELLIVVLGDLADTHEKIHVLALRSIIDFLEKITSLGLPVFYVVGNHDMINNRVFLENYHSFVGINMPHLCIVDKPIANYGFSFCPYVPPGRFLEALEPLTLQHNDVGDSILSESLAVFCHQEFRGAQMGAIVSTIGDQWPEDYPLAISGHIHDYQRIGPNVIYPGAPMQHSYGDNADKTVSLYRFKDGKYAEVRIPLKLTKKITVALNIKEAESYVVPENTSVRINLIGSLESITAFKKTEKFIQLQKSTKVVLKYTDKVTVRPSSERLSYMELLKRSCEGESDLIKKTFKYLIGQENVSQT